MAFSEGTEEKHRKEQWKQLTLYTSYRALCYQEAFLHLAAGEAIKAKWVQVQ